MFFGVVITSLAPQNPEALNFNPNISYESVGHQHAHQYQALQQMLAYLQEHSPFYKRLFDAHHITIGNIHSLSDMHFLPTTTKADMQAHNWDFLCVPSNQIKEYTATS